MMETQLLHGFWQVRPVDTQEWLPASVPGGVHTDLMAAGKIPDPFYGTDEEKVQWVAEKNWEYRRFFYPHTALFRQEKIWLICEGLDTLADVRLNGKIIGQTNNMFRRWQWDVKDMLREGENKLEILFRSPVAYIKARERVRRLREMSMGIRGGPHLRKIPSHFGWDWGPRLPGMGIWKEIRLEGRSRGRLNEIRFDQEHTPGVVNLTARVECELWEAGDTRHTVRLRITGPEREVWQLDAPARPQAAMTVTIANPQLWWPNGYGAQALYTAEVELLGDEDAVIDKRSYTLGLRTVTLAREGADPAKKSFTFVVNGVPIFCKGSNWIPVDAFPARITSGQVEALVRAAAETHHNMLRVWGGGAYESDVFYDLCDRYGILVWQDFLFACATYPLDDPAYLENVRGEVIENTRRLRHHASLALWCGNNEIEWIGSRLGWFRQEKEREAYRCLFFQDLPAILAQEDPGRLYWPGSPSSDDPFNDPCSSQAGDAHLWEVFHEFRPPVYYRQQNPCFVSEFGFQAPPAQATIEQFCPPAERRIDSRVMAAHQRALGGNPRLTWYMAQRFRLPRSFEGYIYLAQVMQAEVVRTGVEHWRRNSDHTSGVLYWQLNDCWPVVSWSSIDYYGRWKALHYAARRFFAPVLLSIEESTQKKQRLVNVWVSNDRREAWQGRIHWTLETLDGEIIEGGDQTVEVAPLSSSCQLKLNFAHHNGKVDWRKLVFTAELWQGSQQTALQVTAFVPEKQMPVIDPGLHAEASLDGERLVVQVSAKRLARFVELSLPGADARFSDNYFDLPAGRTRVVECTLPAGWSLEQAQASLQCRSLHDTGPLDSATVSHWKGDLALLSTVRDLLWKGLILPSLRR